MSDNAPETIRAWGIEVSSGVIYGAGPRAMQPMTAFPVTEYRRADLPPTPEQIAADPRVKALLEKVAAVLDAFDSARMVHKGGVCGMTIDAQFRASVYNGVPVMPGGELRDALAAFQQGDTDE